MKKALIVAMALVCHYFVNAQDFLTIKLKDTQNRPMANVEVKAVNQSKNILVTSKTDALGIAVLKLTQVGIYSLSYLEIRDFSTYEVKEGIKGTFQRSVTYDPKKYLQ